MDKYAKAIIGAVVAGAGALGTAIADGHVTAQEWVFILATAVAGLAAVWGYPNAQP